jgi:TRAP-type C4-dicarboxylate transport system permease small subunit
LRAGFGIAWGGIGIVLATFGFNLAAPLAHIPRWLMIPAAMFGHGLMQARQLRQIKRRAENVETLCKMERAHV